MPKDFNFPSEAVLNSNALNIPNLSDIYGEGTPVYYAENANVIENFNVITKKVATSLQSAVINYLYITALLNASKHFLLITCFHLDYNATTQIPD